MKTSKVSFLLLALNFIFLAVTGHAAKAITLKDSVLNSSLSGKTFMAMPKGKTAVSLRWSADKTLNTRKFIIERSGNGHVFYPIGEMSASLSANRIEEYNYTDGAPQPGYNFYRLREVAVNGAIDVSGTSFIDMEITSDLVVEEQDNKDIISLLYLTNEPLKINITVTDTKGKIVFRNATKAQKGENRIIVFTKDFPQGDYFITAISEEGRKTVGFVK